MGSRQEGAVESQVERQTLDDPELGAALQAQSQVMDRARGPRAHIQILRNNVGGPVTMTTSCSRLLSALSVSRPCLRLIDSAVQGHLKVHRDGGLLTGSLCLHLIRNAVNLDGVGRVCVKEAYGVFLRFADEYLNAENCPIVLNVDTSNLKLMLGYIQHIISAKPVCGLRPASAGHMSQLVLKAFLTSVPDTPQTFLSDRVYVLQQDKNDLMASEMVEGLVLDWPEKCAQFGAQDLKVSHGASKAIKIALVGVSMSGDAEEVLSNQVEAQQQVVQSAADLILSKMLAFCDWLVEHQVCVLLCQKVIHPRVKGHLRQRGVLFAERLGLQPMTYIQDLTGASVIGSVLVRLADAVFGTVNEVEHLVLHGKSYLHLHRAHSCVCTLLLCAPLEQQLAELRCAVQSALWGLCSTFQRPRLLCGGGCWQVHLAAYLRHMVRKRREELCSELAITEAQLESCVQAFLSALEATASSLLASSPFQAWVDTQHWHSWPAPPGVDLATETAPFFCACGMLTNSDVDGNSFRQHHRVEKDRSWMNFGEEWGSGVHTKVLQVGDGMKDGGLVLDTADSSMSAVQTAVITACTVLSLTQFIHDVN